MPDQIAYDKDGILGYIDEKAVVEFDRVNAIKVTGWETKPAVVAKHKAGASVDHNTGKVTGNN